MRGLCLVAAVAAAIALVAACSSYTDGTTPSAAEAGATEAGAETGTATEAGVSSRSDSGVAAPEPGGWCATKQATRPECTDFDRAGVLRDAFTPFELESGDSPYAEVLLASFEAGNTAIASLPRAVRFASPDAPRAAGSRLTGKLQATSHRLHFEEKVFIESVPAKQGDLLLFRLSIGYDAQLLTDGVMTTLQAGSGTFQSYPSSVFLTLHTWHQVVLDIDFDANVLVLTIDGTSAASGSTDVDPPSTMFVEVGALVLPNGKSDGIHVDAASVVVDDIAASL